MDTETWETQRLQNAVKHRCIEVLDLPEEGMVDYYTIYKCQDLNEIYGNVLVDLIIENRFFPNGRW